MLIDDHRWEQVLGFFDEEERAQLAAAFVGMSKPPHPAGNIVDEGALSEDLRAKVYFHFNVRAAKTGGAK